MRDRQYLGALRVRDGVITLEQLYFHDEIRPVDEIKPPKTKVTKEELAMAERLIDNFAGDFKPEKYKDTYRDALCEIIRAKRAGKEVSRAPETEEEAPPDLLEALRASIEAGRPWPRREVRSVESFEGGARRACAQGEGFRPLEDVERRADRGVEALGCLSRSISASFRMSSKSSTVSTLSRSKSSRRRGTTSLAGSPRLDGADAAGEVKKLAKPSVPVWTANQLARREPGELRALLRLAEELRKAQERSRGKGVSDLQDRLAEQRRAVRALARLGRDILADEGTLGERRDRGANCEDARRGGARREARASSSAPAASLRTRAARL